MTNGTVLVASPSAIGRQPEASGSSVPAWAARLAENSRLTMLTAWVEVMPTGLSSTSQPFTSRFSRLTRGFCSDAATVMDIRSQAGVDERGARPSRVSFIRLAGRREIALHRGRSQQALDSLRLLEPIVDQETDIGCEFQVDA